MYLLLGVVVVVVIVVVVVVVPSLLPKTSCRASSKSVDPSTMLGEPFMHKAFRMGGQVVLKKNKSSSVVGGIGMVVVVLFLGNSIC